MNSKLSITLLAATLAVGIATVSFWPDDASARAGGGNSTGSRGSRSFSTPRQATPAPTGTGQMRQSTPAATPGAAAAPAAGATAPRPAGATAAPAAAAPHTPAPAPAMPAPSGLSSGLLGGLGGLALGGLLGATLFGGHGGGMAGGAAAAPGGVGGSGIGLLEILLIGGAIWFAFRWFRQQKANESVPAGGMYSAREGAVEPILGQTPYGGGSTVSAAPVATGDDDLAQGLANIASMDPNFDEARFLEGAKMAFQHIQGAWADWSVERLRPLLTERMWTLIQAQAAERKAAGKRDVIEKIRFNQVSISEAWQEAGEDWFTVHFLVEMVDYTTDLQGNVLEGDPKVSTPVEEYWTFNRPVGSRDPNWFLSAIQQPGEVAKSVL
ncbi:MAG: Tim44 domain-containing protein [Magnetococcus sp. XQGC-1]